MKIDKDNFFAVGCLHIGHKNICRGTSSWSSGTRDFDTIDEMNEAVVKSINDKVGAKDVLFMLGDSFFGIKEKTVPYLMNSINCKNIYYVYGNHCRFLRKNIGKYSHFFRDARDRYVVTLGSQVAIINHYAYLVWEEMGRGSWSLCSHSHGNCTMIRPEDTTFKQLDLGWDVFNQPLSYYEIENIMKNKGFANFDHHGKGHS
jgi:calcineurin-like phosphoesterase family protein